MPATGMEAIGTRRNTRSKKLVNRARKGEFNLMWLIVAVIAVVLGVLVMYFIYAGGSKVLNTTTSPVITAQVIYGGSEIVVNIKNDGAGTLKIGYILLYDGQNGQLYGYTSCNSYGFLLNGGGYNPPCCQPIATLKPGDTLTFWCNSPGGNPATQITEVTVNTNVGSYTVSVT